MKHRKITAALAMAVCTALLSGCACVSNAVDKGESMMNDLESSLLGHENSQGNLMNDSSLNDSRLENSAMNSRPENSRLENSHLDNSDRNNSDASNQHGMVNDNGDTSGATGTTNGINGDGSDPVEDGNDDESWTATVKEQLTEEEAIDIALTEAGASRDSAANLTSVLEYDDTTAEPYYDIEFTVGTTQYEYEISALDGSLKEMDRED